MTADLEKFVKRLRERYIVEFPRPREATQGAHSITVHLDRQDAFIRTAGIGLPLMDTAVAEDPHTIHPDVRSDAPELGTRRPLSTRP